MTICAADPNSKPLSPLQDLIEKGAPADLEAAGALLRDYGAALDAEQRQRDAALEALRQLVAKQVRSLPLAICHRQRRPHEVSFRTDRTQVMWMRSRCAGVSQWRGCSDATHAAARASMRGVVQRGHHGGLSRATAAGKSSTELVGLRR